MRRIKSIFRVVVLCLFLPVLYMALHSFNGRQGKCSVECPTVSVDRLCRAHQDRGELEGNGEPVSHRYSVVIAIITGPYRREERSVMRETWLSDMDQKRTAVKFVIGTGGLNDQEMASLKEENGLTNDLLLLEDFREDFSMLSRKVLVMMSWFAKNMEFDYLFKGDDDTYVTLPLLLNELDKRPSPGRFYWGFFDGRSSVKRIGKWKESDWILCDKYLPYALGGGYILSRELVKFIASNKEFFKMYKNEDVSVGTWLAGIDMERRHDRRFDTEYKSRGCHNSFLVTHKQTVKDMRDKHQNLREMGKLCSSEIMVKPSYEYNWKVPPSQCCQRSLRLP